jgi:hypothetical protein
MIHTVEIEGLEDGYYSWDFEITCHLFIDQSTGDEVDYINLDWYEIEWAECTDGDGATVERSYDHLTREIERIVNREVEDLEVIDFI